MMNNVQRKSDSTNSSHKRQHPTLSNIRKKQVYCCYCQIKQFNMILFFLSCCKYHFRMVTYVNKIPPDNKVHEDNMGPTWYLSAPIGPHVGPMNLAIRGYYRWMNRISRHNFHDWNGSYPEIWVGSGKLNKFDTIWHPHTSVGSKARPDFNRNLATPPVKLRHGWVITITTNLLIGSDYKAMP